MRVCCVHHPFKAGLVELLSDVVELLQRAGPVLLDRFAEYCARWLAGADARLGRAAAQTMGVLAEAEGPKFGRRAAQLLPQLLATLRTHSVASQVSARKPLLPDLACLWSHVWFHCR